MFIGGNNIVPIVFIPPVSQEGGWWHCQGYRWLEGSEDHCEADHPKQTGSGMSSLTLKAAFTLKGNDFHLDLFKHSICGSGKSTASKILQLMFLCMKLKRGTGFPMACKWVWDLISVGFCFSFAVCYKGYKIKFHYWEPVADLVICSYYKRSNSQQNRLCCNALIGSLFL